MLGMVGEAPAGSKFVTNILTSRFVFAELS